MNKRNYYIDFARVIFALIIVYFHVFRSGLFNLKHNIILFNLHFSSTYAAHIVEFFFIVGGFFLYKESLNSNSIAKQILNKIARLWPVLFVSSIIEFIFSGFKYNQFIVKILFLQCIGLFGEYWGVSWFVSSYFWAALFFIIYNQIQVEPKRRFLLYIIIAYVGYVLNINIAGNFDRGVALSFIDLSLFRALAGFAVGHMLGYIIDKIKIENISNKILISLKILMYLSFIYLLTIFLLNDLLQYDPIVLIIMISVFVCASQIITLKQDAPALIKQIAKLSKYSYSVYLMQQSGFHFVETFFDYTDAFRNDLIRAVIYFVVAVIVGVISYYLIERKTKKLSTHLDDLFYE